MRFPSLYYWGNSIEQWQMLQSGYHCTMRPLKKGKIKVKLSLKQAMKARQGSRGITLLFLEARH
jgi:hypothetical protein